MNRKLLFQYALQFFARPMLGWLFLLSGLLISLAAYHTTEQLIARPAFRQAAETLLPLLVLTIGLVATLSVFITLRLLAMISARAEARATASEQRLAATVASLTDVIWSMALPDRSLQYITPAAAKVMGLDLSAPCSMDRWRTVLSPEEYERVQDWLTTVSQGEAPMLEASITLGDGQQRWLQVRGWRVCAADGTPLRIDGIATDITERRATDSLLRKLSRAVEQSPASVVITDTEGRVEYVNPHFLQVTGLSAEEAIGQKPSIIASGLTPSAVYAALWTTIKAGDVWKGEILNRRKNGELFWELEVIAPVFDSDGQVCNFVAVKEDITDKKNAEAELLRVNRTLQVLGRCNVALMRAGSEPALLEAMCDVLAETGGYRLVWIGFRENDAEHHVRLVAQRGFDTPQLRAAIDRVRWDESAFGQGPTGKAIRSGRVVVELDLSGSRFAPWASDRDAIGINAITSLPLIVGGEVLGALSLYAVEAQAFDNAEVALLTELAENLAYGVSMQRKDVERRQQEDTLRLMRRAIEASTDGIMIADHRQPGSPLVYVNGAFERITGYASAEAIGRSVRLLQAGDVEQSGLAELADAIATDRETRVELRNYRKNGQMFWNELAIAPVKDGSGAVTHVVGVMTDITERKSWESRLEYQATHDALTDLPNRLLLADRVGQAIASARREQDCVALMLLDLDRFKLVNDSLGHAVGDSLLQHITTRLLARVRDGDTVARLGGDEFVVVAKVQDEYGAAAIAQALLKTIAEPHIVSGQQIAASASLGIALYPRDGDNLAMLLRNADSAMYRAKTEGVHSPQFYAEELTASTGRRLQLESALRQALEQNEFLLHFQPKVNLDNGQLAGAEVLLRWQSPEFGRVNPAEFIPIAEETGLIVAIGEWVLRASCQQLADWQAQGLPLAPLAVNLSARQFASANLPERIADALANAGIGAEHLHLELTESILVHRPDAAAQVLGRLRDLGIKLALDDFGTGYSSLSYLRRFPINYLKIDQSFVRELVHDPDSATIALSIINLAHNLRMTVIAEGVEIEAQLNFLRRHGCDQVQGYLLGRPVTADIFQEILSNPDRLLGSRDSEEEAAQTLLLLDDEPYVLNALKRVFAREGYRVLTASRPHEALELLAANDVNVILSDQRMPEMTGAELFRLVKVAYPNTIRMILSGYSDLESLAKAINEGAVYKFLTKPWDDEQLKDHIREAFRHHRQGQLH